MIDINSNTQLSVKKPNILFQQRILIWLKVKLKVVHKRNTWIFLQCNNRLKITQKEKDVSAQSCLTLCNPIDYSPADFSVHGIFQARILEWVAIFYSRGSSQPSDWTHISCVSCICRQILYHWATCKKVNIGELKWLKVSDTTDIKKKCYSRWRLFHHDGGSGGQDYTE